MARGSLSFAHTHTHTHTGYLWNCLECWVCVFAHNGAVRVSCRRHADAQSYSMHLLPIGIGAGFRSKWLFNLSNVAHTPIRQLKSERRAANAECKSQYMNAIVSCVVSSTTNSIFNACVCVCQMVDAHRRCGHGCATAELQGFKRFLNAALIRVRWKPTNHKWIQPDGDRFHCPHHQHHSMRFELVGFCGCCDVCGVSPH